MDPLLLLGGGALLWWWSTRPATMPVGSGTELAPGTITTTLPLGTIVLPDGTTLPPGTTIPPPTTFPPGTTIVPGWVVPPGGTLPSGGSIIPGITGPPDVTVIPDPRPLINVIRDVTGLVTFTPAPDVVLDPSQFTLGTPPEGIVAWDTTGITLSPDAVIGTIDLPTELLSIQEEVEGLLGVSFESDTALLEAMQALSPDEVEAVAFLVADQSGLTFDVVKTGFQQLGLIGGPLAMGMGIFSLTQGNVAGVAGIVGGLGVTLTALASTGAAATLGMDAAAVALSAGLGAGLALVGGIAALGPLFNSLFNRGGIFSTDVWQSPTPERSMASGRAAHNAMVGALQSATTLAQVTAIANARWAPHGELQIGSTWAVFGWAGDWDDPVSPEWLRALTLLRTPVLVALGLPWVPDFIRGLWVQGPGQTGDVPYNPETSYLLQQTFAAALPAVSAYAEIRAAYLPGGAQYEAEQARLAAEAAAAEAARQAAIEQEIAIYFSYGPSEFYTPTLSPEAAAVLALRYPSAVPQQDASLNLLF